jgi:hypothetical protein
MKLGELKALGHNIADSLSSGIGLLIGVYDVDIYRAAASSRNGYIDVNFIAGTSTCGIFAFKVRRAIRLYAKALPDLCRRHALDLSEIKLLSARFATDPLIGPNFTVTVEASDGRRSVDQYAGFQGKRVGNSVKPAA